MIRRCRPCTEIKADMILVVSYEGEEHTASVVNLLRAEGREVVQIDLADFPVKSPMAINWSSDAKPNTKLRRPPGWLIWQTQMLAGGAGFDHS